LGCAVFITLSLARFVTILLFFTSEIIVESLNDTVVVKVSTFLGMKTC
jgi:hypothetical protein